MCSTESKISTVRENCTPEASFKDHRGNISCSQWWHQHMCTKPTRLHAWAFEWVEEEIESEDVWGGKREKERLYGFHVSVAVIFSVMRLDCLWTVFHAYKFVGWSQLDIKHPDTEGEGLFFRDLRGNVTVSPLKPCIYALLIKCDRELSWMCLHGGKSTFVHIHIHVCTLQC